MSSNHLTELYQRLSVHFGHRNWWPAKSPFEVAVGAVLTQNTNWQNVAKAIANLKEARVLSLKAMRSLPPAELAELIRPAGYYNIKQKRLRNLLDMLADGFGGSLTRFMKLPLDQARERLLAVNGVGPETADSILLYAGGKPSFVIDAYTFRIVGRHGLDAKAMDYHQLRTYFMDRLPADTKLYNDFHAQLVSLGKNFCKKNNPLCGGCPAEGWRAR